MDSSSEPFSCSVPLNLLSNTSLPKSSADVSEDPFGLGVSVTSLSKTTPTLDSDCLDSSPVVDTALLVQIDSDEKLPPDSPEQDWDLLQAEARHLAGDLEVGADLDATCFTDWDALKTEAQLLAGDIKKKGKRSTDKEKKHSKAAILLREVPSMDKFSPVANTSPLLLTDESAISKAVEKVLVSSSPDSPVRPLRMGGGKEKAEEEVGCSRCNCSKTPLEDDKENMAVGKKGPCVAKGREVPSRSHSFGKPLVSSNKGRISTTIPSTPTARRAKVAAPTSKTPKCSVELRKSLSVAATPKMAQTVQPINSRVTLGNAKGTTRTTTATVAGAAAGVSTASKEIPKRSSAILARRGNTQTTTTPAKPRLLRQSFSTGTTCNPDRVDRKPTIWASAAPPQSNVAAAAATPVRRPLQPSMPNRRVSNLTSTAMTPKARAPMTVTTPRRAAPPHVTALASASAKRRSLLATPIRSSLATTSGMASRPPSIKPSALLSLTKPRFTSAPAGECMGNRTPMVVSTSTAPYAGCTAGSTPPVRKLQFSTAKRRASGIPSPIVRKKS